MIHFLRRDAAAPIRGRTRRNKGSARLYRWISRRLLAPSGGGDGDINGAAGTRSPARRTTTAQLGRSRVLELESGLGQHSNRCRVLEFRLLYLRANRLERWEIIEAETALAAVHEAASRPSDDITELWSDHGKIAIFRPVGGHAGAWPPAHTSRDTP